MGPKQSPSDCLVCLLPQQILFECLLPARPGLCTMERRKQVAVVAWADAFLQACRDSENQRK